MNEHHSYEKHLAEKLQKAPVPDVEPSWQQMKLLLDKEMPRRGGYWKWLTGLGILLLMLGGWIFTQSLPSNEGLAKSTPAVESTANGQETADGNSSEKIVVPQPEVSPEKTSAEKLPEAGTNNAVTKTENDDQTVLINQKEKQKESELEIGDSRVDGESARTVKTNPTEEATNKPQASNRSSAFVGPKSKASSGAVDNQAMNNLLISGQQPLAKSENVTQENLSAANLAVPHNTNDLGIHINQSITSTKNLPAGITAADLAKQRAKAKSLTKFMNRKFTVGFSLPLGFPLGDQKPGPYNVNARPNTISDYLPVPHVQYFVNDKVYVQSEIQFMTPQYIQPVLLYQRKVDQPSNNTALYYSTYARKLYYFNVPLAIHYSPFRNFYLGTGLQFSSLLSGVAMYEERRSFGATGRDTLVSMRYEKFKNDTLSSAIDGSEFRLMLDANYYWNRFTVGLRYNQALSNYISVRLTPSAPYFQDKNKSLQFYLRYNLWENKKK